MCFSEEKTQTVNTSGTQDQTQRRDPGLGTGGQLRRLSQNLGNYVQGLDFPTGPLPTPTLAASDPTQAAAAAATGLVGGSPLQSAAEQAAVRATQFQDPLARFAGLQNLGFGTQGLQGLSLLGGQDTSTEALLKDPLISRGIGSVADLLGRQARDQLAAGATTASMGGRDPRNVFQQRLGEDVGRGFTTGLGSAIDQILGGRQRSLENQRMQALTQLGAIGGRSPQDLLGLSTGEQGARLAGAQLFPGFQGANVAGIQGALGAGRQLEDIDRFNQISQLESALQPFNLTGKALGTIGNIGSLFGTTNTQGTTTGQTQTPYQAPTMAANLFNVGTSLLPLLSDRRLKTNITRAGEENGIPVYHFAYKKDPRKMFKGVMAQDLLGTEHSDAVHMNPDDGMFYVDYRRLGIEMEAV